MSVSFRLPSAHALDRVGFAWSPLFEAVLSLPPIVQPTRTPMHLPWARRCRDLSPDLLEEIRTLTGRFDDASGSCLLLGGFVPGIFEVGLGRDLPSFEAELEALAHLDEDLVAYELSLAFGGSTCGLKNLYDLSTFHDAAYRHQVLAVAAGDPRREALARAVFDDPCAVRDRYIGMLARYWEEAFADEWARILPRIEAEVTTGAHAFVTGGAPKLVSAVLPEGRWEAETSSIVVEKEWDGDCDVAERGRLLFVPTVFGWPRVLIELAEPWPLLVIFPLRELRYPAVPHASDAEVVEGFRAFGDQTRLQIARLVAESPRSTSELAELLSLSDSAVSRHLKIMESAGLVSSTRDGYYVLYRLQAERLDVLGGALRATLGLATAPGASMPALPVSLHRDSVGG